MNARSHFILICFFFSSLLTQGQVTLNASVDRNPVGMGERFRYTLTLDGAQGNIKPPPFKNFKIIGGPQTSSNMSWVNGEMTASSSQTYFLTPKTKGTFKIEAASSSTREGDVSSKALTIEVVEGKGSAAANQSQKSSTAKKSGETANKEELFIRIYTDKRNVSKGEQIVVTYVLYNRYRGFEMTNYEMPKLTGFWKEDVKIDNVSWEKSPETIGGKSYNKAFLARQVLFPQRDGELEIGPYSLDARIGRSFFNQGQQVELKSNTVKINVSPLPSAPSNYNGAVGSFDMTVKLDQSEVLTNEAINLTVKISGSGNLKLINELPIDFPSDFEVYDPKISDRISTNAGGVKGSRTFEYLIIPRYPGMYDLDKIEFAYFDPTQKKYRYRRSEPLTINVQKSAHDEASSGNVTVRKEDVTILDTDIRHIDSSVPKWKEKNSFFAGSILHMAGIGFPILAVIGMFFFRRRQKELDADVDGSRRKKAGKEATKHLAEAKKMLDSGNTDAFYEQLYSSINGYLANKFGMGASDLNTETIRARLTSHGIEESLLKRIEDLRSNCEMARYAPTNSSSASEVYQNAEGIINQFENQGK